MSVRAPAVAGQFYPASAKECWAEVKDYLAMAGGGTGAASSAAKDHPVAKGPEQIHHMIGGIVPHAGWVCSGAVAAEVIQALTRDQTPETVVIFGAVHRMSGPQAAVFGRGHWRTPLGDAAIDEELASAVVQASSTVVADPDLHRLEHSIEVQVPFVQYVARSAKLLPIMVPPGASSALVGRVVAQQAQAIGRKVTFLGSTDLTHYGPRYQFAPQGVGTAGLKWAKAVNDRRMLDLILRLQADAVVGEAQQHHNACGGGAVAAAIAAGLEMGADRAQLLRHTTSYEVLRSQWGEMDDSVGYAGVVFGRAARAQGPDP